MKGKKTPDEKMKSLGEAIKREIKRWIEINENGCWDPSWPDGTNMNLVRRHIIWAKAEMVELHLDSGIALPEEYYLVTPPKTDDYYMVDPSRADRLLSCCGKDKITTEKAEYDQLTVMMA